MQTIHRFRGEYYFLSNFYECPVKYNGYLFNSVEAAFQASKSDIVDLRFCTMSPGKARSEGYKLKLREDWEEVKDSIMKDILLAKFMLNKELSDKLIATGDALLIEGNTWHDNYWGVCTCGTCAFEDRKNKLGVLLMEVRAELARAVTEGTK